MSIRHGDFDWEGHRRMSDDAYEKARITGDMQPLKSHDLLKDGDLELKFALSLARIYFGATPDKGKALDVACGCGYMTDCLAKNGFDATGIDISEEAIALANHVYPDMPFLCGDGTKPEEFFDTPQFDLIHIRELHPFTRVDDFDFQIGVIEKYLRILNKEGFLLINHSRRKDCGNLDFDKVKDYFQNSKVKTAGPLYWFPHKHLGIPPVFKPLNLLLSALTKAYSRLRRRYPIEFFVMYKSGKG